MSGSPAARRPPIRVLVAKPGLDGHDVGAKLTCRALRDAGMEVIYTGLRQSPKAIVDAAVSEDVDVLGLSVLSGAHLPSAAAIASLMREAGIFGEVVWIVGGNIPRRDHAALAELGVDGIFGTGARFEDIVRFIEERTGR